MSHPLLLSHLPCTTSTSSSSFTLPSTTTPGHAPQSGQHDLLQEHQCIINLFKNSQSKSNATENWRENQPSGGNPRKTFSTGFEPKELATVSRISRITDPYQLYDVQEKVGEYDHRAPITEQLEEFGETGTAGVPDLKIPETSCFQSQMHFDDSVESIADSDLEDGELQKMLTSPLYAQKSSGRPDATVMQERDVSAQLNQNRKRKFEVSFI